MTEPASHTLAYLRRLDEKFDRLHGEVGGLRTEVGADGPARPSADLALRVAMLWTTARGGPHQPSSASSIG